MNVEVYNFKKTIGTMKTITITKKLNSILEEIKSHSHNENHNDNLYLQVEIINKELELRGFKKHEILLSGINELTCIICDNDTLRKCHKCQDFICICGHHTEFFKDGGKEWKIFGSEGFCFGDCLHKKQNTKVVDRKQNYITIKTTCLNCGYFYFANLDR